MKKLLIFFTFLFSILILTSCAKETVKITGELIEKEIEISELDKLYISNIHLKKDNIEFGPKIELINSNVKSIIIKLQESLFNELNINKDSNELDINGSHFKKYETSYDLKIIISGYKLSELDLSTNSILYSENNTINDKNLNVKLSGASILNLNDIAVEKANFKLSGASIININSFKTNSLDIEMSGASIINVENININNIDAELSGASFLNFEGEVFDFDLELSGASSLSNYELRIKSLTVDASGASNIKVYVTDSINGHISGASALRYKGYPNINVKSSGASNVYDEN